jgi:hypothetical protein
MSQDVPTEASSPVLVPQKEAPRPEEKAPRQEQSAPKAAEKVPAVSECLETPASYMKQYRLVVRCQSKPGNPSPTSKTHQHLDPSVQTTEREEVKPNEEIRDPRHSRVGEGPHIGGHNEE